MRIMSNSGTRISIELSRNSDMTCSIRGMEERYYLPYTPYLWMARILFMRAIKSNGSNANADVSFCSNAS
jgi:hypothetical protein